MTSAESASPRALPWRGARRRPGGSVAAGRRRSKRGLLVSYGLLVPVFGFLGVFIGWPLLQGLFKSLFNYNGGTLNMFTGLDNYTTLLLHEPLFWPSVVRVLVLTGAAMLQSTLIPLAAAWMVHHFRGERVKYLFRILVMVPVVVPGVVITLIWQNLLAADGAVNRILHAVGLGALAHSWLGDPSTVLIGLILVNFPWLSGINCLLYLAAFRDVPRELYEAAALDGAGRLRTFFRIESRFISAQVRIILVLTLVITLQTYQTIYILTDGGPADASVVPGLLLFRNAFSYGELGYANAIAVTIALMMMALLGAGMLASRIRKAVR